LPGASGRSAGSNCDSGREPGLDVVDVEIVHDHLKRLPLL
jgi:hypothetical protein